MIYFTFPKIFFWKVTKNKNLNLPKGFGVKASTMKIGIFNISNFFSSENSRLEKFDSQNRFFLNERQNSSNAETGLTGFYCF